MMRITLQTSIPGEVYRDRGPTTAVMNRLRRTCPLGGTVIQAATAARAASVRARRGALRALGYTARLLTEAGHRDEAEKAATLADKIKADGLLSCYLPELKATITRAAATMERAA